MAAPVTKQQLIDAGIDAADFAEMVNGPLDNEGDGRVTTRYGGRVKTIRRLERDAQDIIVGFGLLPPVPYAAGIVIDGNRKTVTYGGNVYAPAVAVPFTTGAAFDPAQWVLAGGRAVAANRTVLKGTSPGFGGVCDLTERGREGAFTYDATVPVATHQADVREGVYVAPDATKAGAWRRILAEARYYLPWFGDDDANAAMKGMVRAHLAARVTYPDGQKAARVSMDLPGGVYSVTQSEVLFPGDVTDKQYGYVLTGNGAFSTTIQFSPSDGGSNRLLYNNNAFLFGRISGITFIGNSRTNEWMRSVCQNPPGAVQDYHLTDVAWTGVWGLVLRVVGNNNNSEWSFIRTQVGGECATFLRLGTDASDQNVSFWWSHGKFNPTTTENQSRMIDADRGGHFRITDYDFAGWQNVLGFRLAGASHSFGTCVFSVQRARVELKSASAVWSECEWPSGNYTLEDVDFSSQTPGYPSSTVFATFRTGNTPGPTIVFNRCQLIGRVRFEHGTNAFETRARATFTQCEHTQFPDFYDMFDMAVSTNDVGQTIVDVHESCRGAQFRLFTATAWAANTAYAVGDQRRNGQSLYEVTIAGTSAGSGGPTGKGSTITDGGVTWKFVRNGSRDYVVGSSVGGANYYNPAARVRRAVFGGPAPLNGGSREVILPPDCRVLRVGVEGKPTAEGGPTSNNPNVYTFSTVNPDTGATVTLLAVNDEAAGGKMSAGFSFISGQLDHRTKKSMDARTIIFKVGQFVNQPNASAVVWVEYEG